MPEQQGLKRYLETLRERIWIVVACVVLALAAAIVYVVTADRVYEAQANLLITPVPAENATFVTLGLLRESNDPSREVETATQLVNTHAVAERVSTKLGGDRSPDELLGNVEATPVAQSNIVAVIAKSGSAAGAAELANAFAEQAIAQTTDELHARIDGVLPELRDQVASLPADEPTAQELSAELVQLEILRAGVDPTMTLVTPATEPSHPSSPKVVLTIAGAEASGFSSGSLPPSPCACSIRACGARSSSASCSGFPSSPAFPGNRIAAPGRSRATASRRQRSRPTGPCARR